MKLSEWKRKGADVVNQSRWTRSTNASLVLDAEGREIDGNDDGQPGGNYVATLNKQGVISAAISSARAGRISARAVDALLLDGHLDVKTGIRRGHSHARR